MRLTNAWRTSVGEKEHHIVAGRSNVIGAPVGSATITYTGNSAATLAYTINGISATKSIQRQVFSSETTGANLRVNDIWWATAAEPCGVQYKRPRKVQGLLSQQGAVERCA